MLSYETIYIYRSSERFLYLELKTTNAWAGSLSCPSRTTKDGRAFSTANSLSWKKGQKDKDG